MSTSWQIVCEDCKEYMYMGDVRLAGHWLLGDIGYDEINAINDWEEFDSVFIRSALHLVAFQKKHFGHQVRAVTEHNWIWNTELGSGYYGNAEILGYKEVHRPLLYDDEVEEWRESHPTQIGNDAGDNKQEEDLLSRQPIRGPAIKDDILALAMSEHFGVPVEEVLKWTEEDLTSYIKGEVEDNAWGL